MKMKFLCKFNIKKNLNFVINKVKILDYKNFIQYHKTNINTKNFSKKENKNQINLMSAKEIHDIIQNIDKIQKENSNKKKENNQNKGSVNLIIGPMFAGKTSELIKEIIHLRLKGKKTLMVGFLKDTRYNENDAMEVDEKDFQHEFDVIEEIHDKPKVFKNKVITHDKIEYPAIKCLKLNEIKEMLAEFEVVGIDEGQFFEDLVEVVEYLANEKGVHIYISALNANFKRESFDAIAHLIPKSDTLKSLTSNCYFCGSLANFSLRIVNNKEEILVGGEESYKAACRSCYLKKYI